MSKTILIAPFAGAHAAALAERAHAEGWRTALAGARGVDGSSRSQKSASGIQKSAQDAEHSPVYPSESAFIAYDPRSCASASALVLSAANALGGRIDAAVIMSDTISEKADFPAGKPADIAQLVDAHCAGPLYLARELVRRFEEQGFGRILLFSLESPRDAEAGPPTALIHGAFEGLGRGLFAASRGKAWSAYGLCDASAQPDRASRFALELLEEVRAARAGRWMRFSGKSGLFG